MVQWLQGLLELEHAFARQLTANVLLRVAGVGLAFLVGVQLARFLGPAGYGVYGTAMALLSTLLIPVGMGVPRLLVRDIAIASANQDGSRVASLLKWALRWMSLSALLTVIGVVGSLYLAWELLDAELAVALLAGLPWLILFAASNLVAAVLQGAGRSTAAQLGTMLIQPMLVAMGLGITYWLTKPEHISATMALWINAAATSLALLVSTWLMIRWLRGLREGNYHYTMPRLREAFPMGLSHGVRVLSAQFGMLFCGLVLPATEAGYFRVALAVHVVVATMPAGLLEFVFSPRFSLHHSAGDRLALVKANQQMAVLLLGAMTAVAFFFILVGNSAITFVFGAEYKGAVLILLTLIAGEWIAAWLGNPAPALDMGRQQVVVMRAAVASLLINAVLAWLLHPFAGGVGIAIASGVALILFKTICAYRLRTMWMLPMLPVFTIRSGASR